MLSQSIILSAHTPKHGAGLRQHVSPRPGPQLLRELVRKGSFLGPILRTQHQWVWGGAWESVRSTCPPGDSEGLRGRRASNYIARSPWFQKRWAHLLLISLAQRSRNSYPQLAIVHFIPLRRFERVVLPRPRPLGQTCLLGMHSAWTEQPNPWVVAPVSSSRHPIREGAGGEETGPESCIQLLILAWTLGIRAQGYPPHRWSVVTRWPPEYGAAHLSGASFAVGSVLAAAALWPHSGNYKRLQHQARTLGSAAAPS